MYIEGPEVVATIFKKGDFTISSKAEFAVVVGRGKFQGSFVFAAAAAAMSACTLDGDNGNARNNVTMEKGRKESTDLPNLPSLGLLTTLAIG